MNIKKSLLISSAVIQLFSVFYISCKSEIYYTQEKLRNETISDVRSECLDFIFNNNTLGKTTISIKRSEWNKLCDNYRYFYKNENCVHAENYKYEKDGKCWSIPNVGFRLRGNTSRFCPQGIDNGREQEQMNASWSEEYYNYAEKKNNDYRQSHFKVDFEEFLEEGEDCKMSGCLKGVALKRMDASCTREVFCYDLFHRYGIWTAPRASYTRLIFRIIEDNKDNIVTTVNYGVYEMFEEVNKQSLKARALDDANSSDNAWKNDKGNLWKCQNDLTDSSGNGMGVEKIEIVFDENGKRTGKINESYGMDLKTNKDKLDPAKEELMAFISELNALSETDIDGIREFYSKRMDVDFFIKTIAVSVLMGMDDDYWGNGNNFCLYFDTGKKGSGKVYYIPYDYDNTLGGSIHEGGFKNNPLEWGMGENRPLIDKLLCVPEYKQKYIDYLLDLSAENSEWNAQKCVDRFKKWQSMVIPYLFSKDLDYHIGVSGIWDGTWQPANYHVASYNDNIYDATRKSFTEWLKDY
ncbi:MAG: CotH kinase family protein [Treponema sp.]|nr:CotH kinase family protein [Treponema sp.]